jgi:hypothetical protein
VTSFASRVFQRLSLGCGVNRRLRRVKGRKVCDKIEISLGWGAGDGGGCDKCGINSAVRV